MGESSDTVGSNLVLAKDNLIDRRLALGAMAGAVVTSAQTLGLAAARGASASNLAEQLADYVAGIQYAALDEKTIDAAKSLFIDALGCAIAAHEEKPVRAVREVALSVPGGVSTVVGTAKRTTPDLAAFANSAAIRYYDFNDLYLGREPAIPAISVADALRSRRPRGAAARIYFWRSCWLTRSTAVCSMLPN